MTRAPMEPAETLVRHPLQPNQLLDRETRVDDLIVLCHLGVARVGADGWSLSIDGLVRRPRRLTLRELMGRPRVEVPSIHQCCGNPLKPDEPTRRITNVRWTGARLSDLLDECEPEAAARFVWSSGADNGSIGGVGVDAYVKDIPIDRVAADVLVAYEMNGAPLRPENGYPARLVVPGYYGTNSVKWLTRLTLADRRANSPFTTRWYNDAVRDASGLPTGTTVPVWAIAPESVVVSPAPDEVVQVGRAVEVWGWAWADEGVDTVEVSFDGALRWNRVAVEPPVGRTWQRFSATWHPERSGSHEVCSRARSTAGAWQPVAASRNAVHRVPVRVA